MTDIIQHDVHEVLAVLDEIVAEFGDDYRYKDHYEFCAYRSEAGQPQCIVGQVLARIAPELLPRVYNTQRWSSQDDIDHFTPEANIVLQAAQNVQDGYGSKPGTWGEALDEAKSQVA